ncbi:hypothetical protein [Pedobacter cryoconitis]|uniref:RES domain-containing protein n=1 Tax=Pedobacter cryoconitis TaxID=188932 RepID=A0A7X0MJG9_9SPHI|nr:hypothetical protein [Pedobacter cryoconitis]MBB6500986.1 RES domain-containing protein [Pedobacter cryoconitis]
MEVVKRKKYESPKLEVAIIELEQGIAASSATVTPVNANITVEDITDITPGDADTQRGDF